MLSRDAASMAKKTTHQIPKWGQRHLVLVFFATFNLHSDEGIPAPSVLRSLAVCTKGLHACTSTSCSL